MAFAEFFELLCLIGDEYFFLGGGVNGRKSSSSPHSTSGSYTSVSIFVLIILILAFLNCQAKIWLIKNFLVNILEEFEVI